MTTSSTQVKINADKIRLFFGAGSSVQFGIPSMKRITSTFAKKVNRKRVPEMEKSVFNTVHNSLAKIYGKGNVDLEAIMFVIASLKENNRLQENIGELGLFILQKSKVTNYMKRFGYEITVLDNLERKFKEHIRKSVLVTGSKKIDLIRDVYWDLFKQICTNCCTNCTNTNFPDSDYYKCTHDGWTFFTTNYDNALEDFWVRGRGYYLLYLGFERKGGKMLMKADNFLHNNTGDRRTYAMQLVKLHGSVNWIKNSHHETEEQEYHISSDDARRRRGSSDIEDDVLIYPLSQKQLYFTPFVQFFGILNADLTKRNFWVIVGYSFRDIIIRTMFERALLEDNNRKLILVHPHATQEVRPLFREQVREQIICLDRYFARRNYASVNKEITDELLRLANT